MSDKKQTAVDWLREKFHTVPPSEFGKYFEQAKRIEHIQICNDFMAGFNDCYDEHVSNEKAKFETDKDYYQKTYGDSYGNNN
jgi:hypothetical protein